jgi:hypothetical protein
MKITLPAVVTSTYQDNALGCNMSGPVDCLIAVMQYRAGLFSLLSLLMKEP